MGILSPFAEKCKKKMVATATIFFLLFDGWRLFWHSEMVATATIKLGYP
jgi:hypothetical protein